MSRESLKQKVCEAIDGRSKDIIEIGERIWQNPELGFKEYKTSELVTRVFKKLDLECENGVALTGVVGKFPGDQVSPTVAVMGEMDALVCPDHPDADPVTGAVHACGHHAQIAAMVGTTMGLVDSGVMHDLSGSIVFMAVPAEEYVEIEYRLKLREQGKIRFLGGKQEFIRLGYFDQVDFALIDHLGANMSARQFKLEGTCNGFVGKMAKFVGKAAHAGGNPHEGVNALNAAILGLMGINSIRETFREEDCIRVHPIITKGGDMVNIVPADVRIETYVRGRTVEAIVDASRKVNQALRGGAMAVGANVDIIGVPGYLPVSVDPDLHSLFIENASTLVGRKNIIKDYAHKGFSSDIGDVTHLIPTLTFEVGGVEGGTHTKDFHVADPEMAYVVSAKAFAMTIIDLLYGKAREAGKISAKFKPKILKKDYCNVWDEITSGQVYLLK